MHRSSYSQSLSEKPLFVVSAGNADSGLQKMLGITEIIFESLALKKACVSLPIWHREHSRKGDEKFVRAGRERAI